jgi:hypothetical protein
LQVQPARRWTQWLIVFLVTFVFLFLGMNRGFDFYDEGLNLVGAMRVAAGQVPHRDFYANYGPAQFYILAWLFDWFGTSVFVERIYDLTLRSAIVTFVYGITAAYCTRWLVICTTVVCAFWLFSSGLPTIAYPIIPVTLLALTGSFLLLPMFAVDLRPWRALLAGGIAGTVALFRYDVGAATVVVHLISMAIAAIIRRRAPSKTVVLMYGLGVAAVFLPPAFLYLSVAPIHPFIHDVFLYPAKYYARARRLPFPGIHWRSLENLALYLPPLVAGLSLYTARREELAGSGRKAILIVFGLLGGVFYFKGLVRISVSQMVLSLLPTVIALAVLYEVTARKRDRLHLIVECVMAVSVFSATWSALKEVRVLLINQHSVLQEVLSPSGGAWFKAESAECGVTHRLDTGLCFHIDSGHAQVITYILAHTKPSERIFMGLERHDRIGSNDLLTYFLAARMPATHWAHFDPDLQTRADIQKEMIQELDGSAIRYVFLDSEYDALREQSNDSSVSSGVHLLDDYIRQNYRQVAKFGTISIWLRKGAP